MRNNHFITTVFNWPNWIWPHFARWELEEFEEFDIGAEKIVGENNIWFASFSDVKVSIHLLHAVQNNCSWLKRCL